MTQIGWLGYKNLNSVNQKVSMIDRPKYLSDLDSLADVVKSHQIIFCL